MDLFCYHKYKYSNFIPNYKIEINSHIAYGKLLNSITKQYYINNYGLTIWTMNDIIIDLVTRR